MDDTARENLKEVDRILACCAMVIVDFRRAELLPLIKKGQKLLRQQTNPEMFNENGEYK